MELKGETAILFGFQTFNQYFTGDKDSTQHEKLKSKLGGKGRGDNLYGNENYYITNGG